MQTLDKQLYELTNSKYWKVLEEYLKANKAIVEEHLFNSKSWYIEKPTNWAVVLIKMREVYQKMLDLPETLKWLAEDETAIDKLLETVKDIIDDIS
jgi:hypothetical protein